MGRKRVTVKQLQPALEALRKGATYKLAAKAAGVGESTLHRYIKKGREGDRTWAPFYKDIQLAEHARAEMMLQLIEDGARKDWRAAAWMLERRYGYRKDAPLDTIPDETKAAPSDAVALLRQQVTELQKAATSAAVAQSWQAYAALQRQLLSVVQELQRAEAADETADGLEAMTDEQILGQIEAAVLSMPPVLRQRLQHRLNIDGSNVVKLHGG
jgi:hypothetical protein